MSEAEVARDLHAVLARVQQGIEIVIEHDHRPVANLKASQAPSAGRALRECLALARQYEEALGDAPLPDAKLAKDLQVGIN